MVKINSIKVQGLDISVYRDGGEDFISLTDIVKAKDGDFFVSDWLCNANTLAYLGAWEAMHNPKRNKQGLLYAEEADILNLALFGCTAKEWSEKNPQRVLEGENI